MAFWMATNSNVSQKDSILIIGPRMVQLTFRMPLESATLQPGDKALPYQHILGDDQQILGDDQQILGDDEFVGDHEFDEDDQIIGDDYDLFPGADDDLSSSLQLGDDDMFDLGKSFGLDLDLSQKETSCMHETSLRRWS
jgi:hypothetical protein